MGVYRTDLYSVSQARRSWLLPERGGDGRGGLARWFCLSTCNARVVIVIVSEEVTDFIEVSNKVEEWWKQ